MPCQPNCPLRHHPHNYDTLVPYLQKENDLLKKKLEIATRTLNVIAFYCSSNDELVVGYATEAIVNMSEAVAV